MAGAVLVYVALRTTSTGARASKPLRCAPRQRVRPTIAAIDDEDDDVEEVDHSPRTVVKSAARAAFNIKIESRTCRPGEGKMSSKARPSRRDAEFAMPLVDDDAEASSNAIEQVDDGSQAQVDDQSLASPTEPPVEDEEGQVSGAVEQYELD